MTRISTTTIALAMGVAAWACDESWPTPDAAVEDASADADGVEGADADVETLTDADGSDADLDLDEDRPIDADADTDGDEELGSWSNPIVVESLPFTYRGDSRTAPADLADSYSPCAPGTDESGGELLFVVEVTERSRLRLEVDDLPGDDVDIDLHLLEAPNPESCIARDNVAIDRTVDAGTWWFTADTWVDSSAVEHAGPFVLHLELEPAAAGDCLTSPIDCDTDDIPSPNGVPTEASGTGGCPAGMVRSSGFCIDRYEAMLVEVRADGSLAPWSPYLNPGEARVRALSVAGVVPQGYITGEQADAACREASKRLCTDEEWLFACRGEEDRIYPHGDPTAPGECNVTRRCHPAVQYFESTADWIWSELGHPCINQLPDGLATTGEYSGCITPEGIFDLVGNLHEWTADVAGTFRGGFYVDAEINGRGCLYRTTAHNTRHWDYSTGFRCCAD